VRNVLPFLIVAALLVQWLPLRACAIAKIVTGSNCHTAEVVAGETPPCHMPHPCNSSRSCRCEAPQDPTPRQASSAQQVMTSAPEETAEAASFCVTIHPSFDRPAPCADVSPPSLQSVPLRL
jgi:hypothetical protein